MKNPHEINPFNRGVAVLGHRLFVGTLDAALVALDARTGAAALGNAGGRHDARLQPSRARRWCVKDKVIVGITGGEFGARGFLDAYDAATGKRLWRWYAVPGPGEFGNDTWLGDSWKQGGSPMWLTGSYDPELNLVYWTVGNPGPQIDRSVRGDLDNLFSDSVVAIDADTGQRKWHYQFTPNDGHDWDSCQDVILVDRVWRGQMRKLLLHADRNGYLLRARSHERRVPVGHAVRLRELDERLRREGPAAIRCRDRIRAREGSFFVYPDARSAPPTSRRRRTARSPAGCICSTPKAASDTSARRETFEAGKQYIGRASRQWTRRSVPKPGEPARSAGIKALDPETGKTMWDFKIFQASLANGVLATGGNVVFGAIRDGNLVALDARTATPVALPDRRQHERVAHELRGRRPAVRRHRRRQHALRVRAPGVTHRMPCRSSRASRSRAALGAPRPGVGPAVLRAAQTGDVVQLQDAHDARPRVSIVPSVGNVAFEMKVKGHDVLRWPYRVDRRVQGEAGLSGIPFLAPWANRLDEQAFYANGKRYAFDMELGNVRGADSDPRLSADTRISGRSSRRRPTRGRRG